MSGDEKKIFEKMKLIESVKSSKERMIAAMDRTEDQYNNFVGCLKNELHRLFIGDNSKVDRVV